MPRNELFLTKEKAKSMRIHCKSIHMGNAYYGQIVMCDEGGWQAAAAARNHDGGSREV